MSAEDAKRVGRALLLVVLVIAVLNPIIGVATDLVGGSGSEQTRQVLDPGVGSFADVLGDLALTDSTRVEATLGNALAFDGSSTIDSPHPQNLTRGGWTVCTVAELDESADQNLTFTAAAYENESILLQFDAGNWMAYHNNSTRDGKATIDAPAPTGETKLCGRWNESHLWIARNGTLGGPVALTSSSTQRNVTRNWSGTLDELRTFNESLSDGDLQAYANDPIQPLPGRNRTSRFMFDAGSGSTARQFFANSSTTGVTVSIGGSAWTDGVDQPALDEGSDYELADTPLRVQVVAGGYLDGAPTLWVIRPQGGPFAGVIDVVGNIGSAAFTLLTIAILILGASAMASEFDSF